MRSWRKMTWAILIWTALFIVWGATGVGAVSNECAGMTGDELATCQAATAIGGGIGLTFIFMLWFIGFIVLAIIWFMTRPRNNVTVFGPQGQQMTVSESEARKRVEKQGWTYQPTGSTTPSSSTNQPPPPAGEGWTR
jgi:hypothetical protein